MDELTLTPQALSACIPAYIDARVPLYVHGAPGIGKSSIWQQAAQTAGMRLHDVRVSQLDPVDLRGLPTVTATATTWRHPDWLPGTEDPAILLLDELSDAPPSMQSALYQLVLDRRIGDWRAPDALYIAAAGNRQSDRAAAGRMSTALASRFAHCTLSVSLADWCAWAINAGIRPETIAFVRFRPTLLHDFDAARTLQETAYPCPRTWELASRMTGTTAPEHEPTVLAGIVGQGAATEYVGFLRIFRKLPAPESILMNPSTATVPTDPSTLWALLTALATRTSQGTAPALLQYAGRLPDEWSAMLTRDMITRCPEIQSTRSFVEWCTEHHHLFS